MYILEIWTEISYEVYIIVNLKQLNLITINNFLVLGGTKETPTDLEWLMAMTPYP